jgi:anthranilate phosphoribosyltransferase
MLKQVIEKLMRRENLTKEESAFAIQGVVSGADPYQIAAFLVLMRAKGETAEELHTMIEAMRSAMVRVVLPFPALDIVGTGGDGAHTLNISTASAILSASCGVKIAKHGNSSVSSLAGSADVLEALGIPMNQRPEQIKRSIEEIGIGFMFAPHFHPALKPLKGVRKSLNTPTFFNIVGPLLNPACAEHLMMGVFSQQLLAVAASVAMRLKLRRSFIFHGSGLDELSCIGPSQVIEVSKSGLRSFVLDPLDYGLKRCSVEDLRGKDAQYNAAQIVQVFEGKESAFADTLALNAGVAAYLYGVAGSMQEGIELAKNNIQNKKALNLLSQWKSYA